MSHDICINRGAARFKLYGFFYRFVPNGLTLGDLGGNHFTIVLRNVKDATETDLEESLSSLKNNGFLNYFGMQRFGTSTVLTHTVGCAIMKKDFELASDLILDPREGGKFLCIFFICTG